MKKKININLNFFSFFLLSITLILVKTIDHPPNFSPLISIILISSFLINNNIFLVFIVFSSLLISDLILGIYPGVSLIHLTIIFIAISVKKLFKKINNLSIFFQSIYSSIVFFLFTNPIHLIFNENINFTYKILMQTYIEGVPFFINTLVSTLFFSYLLFNLILKFLSKKKIITNYN